MNPIAPGKSDWTMPHDARPPGLPGGDALFASTISHAIRSGNSPVEVYAWALEQASTNRVTPSLLSALSAARHSAPASFMESSGWVLLAFQNAYYQLLHTSGPVEGVVDTVSRGGDTDTNAAIAGALLGSVYGMRRFPSQWIDRVLTSRPLRGLPSVNRPRPAECWPTDALYLAERLATVEG